MAESGEGQTPREWREWCLRPAFSPHCGPETPKPLSWKDLLPVPGAGLFTSYPAEGLIFLQASL